MTALVPPILQNFRISNLFEVHLPVADLQRSIAFYQDVLGLSPARLSDERNYAFFWIGEPGHQMLGLWGNNGENSPVSPGRSHFAMCVAGNDIREAFDRLRAKGITPLDFYGKPSSEPEVICWMPAATVYFADPDGHTLEFIAMLDDAPRPELGVVVPLSAWSKA